MYTDPSHLRAADPCRVEGNVVFTYLVAFDDDQATVDSLKEHYRCGGLGDVAVKRRLDEILQALLAPIRERRMVLARAPDYVLGVLRQGTMVAQQKTEATLDEVRHALPIFRLDR